MTHMLTRQALSLSRRATYVRKPCVAQGFRFRVAHTSLRHLLALFSVLRHLLALFSVLCHLLAVFSVLCHLLAVFSVLCHLLALFSVLGHLLVLFSVLRHLPAVCCSLMLGHLLASVLLCF